MRSLCLALALVLLPCSLQARSTITRARAEMTALKLVPGGAVISSSLERDGRKLVWWLDVSVPGSRNVKAIQIDAATGTVVSNTLETPEDR